MYLFNVKRSRKKIFLVTLLVMIAALAVILFRMRFPLKYTSVIMEHAALNELDPAYLCAIINTESGFDSNAVSIKGARGLMQLTQMTADWMANELELSDYTFDEAFVPEINIALGAYYLSRLGSRYGKYSDETLAAYNAGSGNVAKWLSDPKYSEDGRKLSHIPFTETRNYIMKVNRYYKVYKLILKLISA